MIAKVTMFEEHSRRVPHRVQSAPVTARNTPTKDAPTPVKQTTFVVPALAKRRILHKASHSHDSLPPASDGARAAPHVASAAPEVHLPPTERIEGLRRLDADVASSPLEPAPAPAGWQEAAESGQTAAGKASAPDSDAKGGRYGSIASPVSTPGPAPGVASLPQCNMPDEEQARGDSAGPDLADTLSKELSGLTLDGLDISTPPDDDVLQRAKRALSALGQPQTSSVAFSLSSAHDPAVSVPSPDSGPVLRPSEAPVLQRARDGYARRRSQEGASEATSRLRRSDQTSTSMDANSAYPVKKPSFLGSPASSRRLGYGPGYSERISVADTDRAHQGRGAKRGPRRYQPPPQAHGAASGPAGPLRARGEREERDTSDSERERDWAAPHMERVRVTVRIRPPLKALREHPGAVEVMGDARTIRVHRYLSARSQVRYTDMSFDSILGPGTTQEEVYNAAARAVVEDVVRGYNGTVMAYGQTGAGKTYTVGNMLSTSGIIPRAASELLQIRDTDEEHDYTLYMSYVQIYCEQVQDLIRPTSDNLPLREDETGQVVLPGVHEVEIQGIQVLQMGERNRTYAFTRLNAQSSRSHAVVIITVEKRPRRQDSTPGDVRTMKVGKLYLVDLAGSERLKKSASEGQRQHEAKAINLCLTTLGMCINARASGNPNAYVPFRDSKLTRLLQESLGGNARTSLIVCVPDAAEHLEETMSSLQFGQRAMSVVTRARVNEVMDPIQFASELEAKVDRAESARKMLQEALFSKQEQIEAMRVAMESEHSAQRQRLKEIAVKYKALKSRLDSEFKARRALEQECQTLKSKVAALEATNAELESHTATLGMSLEAAKEQEGYLRAQLGEATRRAEEEEGGLAELQSDVGKMKEERDRAREEARTKEGLIETMMGDAKELRESNRVLRGLNAELEEQVQEADDRIKTLEAELEEAKALAEKRGTDITRMRTKMEVWVSREAEHLRNARAARRLQRAWRRHRMRQLVAQMAEAQRAMREREAKMKRQEEELKDVQRVREAEAKAAQARHRRFLLWAGAGLVAKSRDLVAAAAEAACHVLLLPAKDLERQMDIKRRNLSSFAESREANDRSRAGSRTGTPRQSRGGVSGATPRGNSAWAAPGGHSPGSAPGSPGSVLGAPGQGSAQGPSRAATSRLLKTRTPLKERLMSPLVKTFSRKGNGGGLQRGRLNSGGDSAINTPRSSLSGNPPNASTTPGRGRPPIGGQGGYGGYPPPVQYAGHANAGPGVHALRPPGY